MDAEFRHTILKQLKQRNSEVQCGYANLIKAYAELLDFVVAIKLRRDSRTNRSSGGDGHSENNELVSNLESKVSQLQAELTDLYRRRSENAQQLMDANSRVQAKEAECTKLGNKLKDTEDTVEALSEAKRNLEQRVKELQETNMHLTDEFIALQSLYSANLANLHKVQEENASLIANLLAYKEKEVMVMNTENDLHRQRKELELQTQLVRAAQEQPLLVEIPLSVDSGPAPAVCVGACLPSRCKLKLDAHENEVFCVLWSPTGRYLCSGGADRKIKLWNIDDGHERGVCTAVLAGCNQSVSSLDVDAEESHLMAGSYDYAVRIWSLADQRLRHSLTGHSGKVMAAKFMHTSVKAVSGSYDRTIKLWDLRTRSCIHTFFPGSSCNDLVACDSAGGCIVSGHIDKKLRFFDARSPDMLRDVLLNGKITSLCLSSQQMFLLCCTREDVLHYFDLRQSRVVHTYSADSFKVGYDFTRAVLSPDDQFCMAGGSDGQLFFWNVMTGKLEKVLNKVTGAAVIACCWNPNGQSVASCDKHRTVSICADF